MDSIGLADEWLGIDVELRSDTPMHLWTFPIASVSQSEGGFELVHQSVVVQPHWYIQAGADGRWTVDAWAPLDGRTLAEAAQEPYARGVFLNSIRRGSAAVNIPVLPLTKLTALIFAAIYYLIPLYVMVVTSLKGMPEIRMGNIFAPPLEITFEPWVKAWATARP